MQIQHLTFASINIYDAIDSTLRSSLSISWSNRLRTLQIKMENCLAHYVADHVNRFGPSIG